MSAMYRQSFDRQRAAYSGVTAGDVARSLVAATSSSRSCVKASREVDLELHAGIHAGDIIRESGNVFGGAVNIAARVADAAGAGEVLVSDVVRSLARTSANVTFEDRGEREMKGIGEPVRVWAVRQN